MQQVMFAYAGPVSGLMAALRQFRYDGESREPRERCPYCWSWCEADWVDNGIGLQQCGPYGCQSCGAVAIGPYDEPRPLTAFEQKTGWYAPQRAPAEAQAIQDSTVADTALVIEAVRAHKAGR